MLFREIETRHWIIISQYKWYTWYVW